MEAESIVRLFSGHTGSVYAFTEEGWLQMLELAREYGWSPLGAQSPPEREGVRWAHSYLPERYRIVSAPDAEALAQALSRAETSLPDLAAMTREHAHRRNQQEEWEDRTAVLNRTREPEDGRWLEGFLSFCRAGEFRIG
ncbi:MAG TPA: hypothetical protein VGS41_13330 [Chthonomonadales bacterium]|nr:hypothetical protein [Chthonomonadales bacterium]